MHRLIFLFAGQGGAALLIMTRNLLLARMIGAESYGGATALLMLLAVVELVTTLGLPQQIVSRRDGASRPVMAALHGVQLARGLLCGGLIALAAYPLAAFLNVPHLGWMLAASGLFPVLTGLCHLDPFRAQRARRHGPQIALLLGPAMVSLLALWPLSWWLSGPEIMLGLIGLQVGSQLTLSHALAKRRYRARFDYKQALTCLKFGLPLAGNGVLLCAVLHFEKAVAGHVFGPTSLAIMALGAALTMTPALTAARSFQTYHLPLLRRGASSGPSASQVFARACNAGSALAILLAFLAPPVLSLVGPSFGPAATLLPYLIVLSALRLPKSGLATTALSRGKTLVPLISNAPRLCAVPVIWIAATSGATLIDILIIACVAEGLGLITGLIASRRSIQPPWLELALFTLTCLLVSIGQAPLAAMVLLFGLGQAALAQYAQSLRVTA